VCVGVRAVGLWGEGLVTAASGLCGLCSVLVLPPCSSPPSLSYRVSQFLHCVLLIFFPSLPGIPFLCSCGEVKTDFKRGCVVLMTSRKVLEDRRYGQKVFQG
jgi:hypothetical protein